MPSFIGLLVVLLLSSTATHSQELKNGTACKEELLQMVCDNDQVLAIHSAIFDGSDTEGCGFMMPINISSLLPANDNSSINSSTVDSRLFSVQSTVNRRCSGQNNCTLQLESDEPSSKSWGDGKLIVQYNCIPVKSARYSCDAVIEILTPTTTLGASTAAVKPGWFPGPNQVHGWGYLSNFGYPEYYRGSTDCRWTIRSTHGRRVRVTILDLSIRSVLHGERECKDVLTVTQDKRLLLNKCGEVEEPLVVESSGDELNLTLSVKSAFIPKRGLLAFFTAIGCPTPRVPKQAYLVSGSNSSRAEFICCVDHVFPDTGLRQRNLTCLDQEGHRWNEDLPDCVDVKQIEASGNKTLIHILRRASMNSTNPEFGELSNYSITYDLIVPCAIIAGLILGNLVILALVLHFRRRSTAKLAKDQSVAEENVPLQETPGPSEEKAGTPV